mmetsp:Transcript_42893/g.108535  ORF Transcript_42893/g.108535 Transcript_42893/m.108535 type:complete len:325 (-) Transcript_42893:301-1275(-)
MCSRCPLPRLAAMPRAAACPAGTWSCRSSSTSAPRAAAARVRRALSRRVWPNPASAAPRRPGAAGRRGARRQGRPRQASRASRCGASSTASAAARSTTFAPTTPTPSCSCSRTAAARSAATPCHRYTGTPHRQAAALRRMRWTARSWLVTMLWRWSSRIVSWSTTATRQSARASSTTRATTLRSTPTCGLTTRSVGGSLSSSARWRRRRRRPAAASLWPSTSWAGRWWWTRETRWAKPEPAPRSRTPAASALPLLPMTGVRRWLRRRQRPTRARSLRAAVPRWRMQSSTRCATCASPPTRSSMARPHHSSSLARRRPRRRSPPS